MVLSLKALHLVSMVLWFTGLTQAFRLLGRAAELREKPEVFAVLHGEARSRIYALGHPAMGVTLLAGFGLIALNPAVMRGGWLHAKLTLLAALVFLQIYAGIAHKKLGRGETAPATGSLRMLGVLPILLLVVVTMLATLRPF